MLSWPSVGSTTRSTGWTSRLDGPRRCPSGARVRPTRRIERSVHPRQGAAGGRTALTFGRTEGRLRSGRELASQAQTAQEQRPRSASERVFRTGDPGSWEQPRSPETSEWTGHVCAGANLARGKVFGRDYV